MYCMKHVFLAFALCSSTPLLVADASLLQQDIFPPQELHVHGSSIVELPNGDFLSGWFQGSGERTADDVALYGARRVKGSDAWSTPFLLADTPDFPDFTPLLVIDGKERLWMFWYLTLAYQWETSLLKYRISDDYQADPGAPKWSWQDVLLVRPGAPAGQGIQPDDPFVRAVEEKLKDYLEYLQSSGQDTTEAAQNRSKARAERILANARGESLTRRTTVVQPDGTSSSEERGFPYFSRMGWQTRNKPIVLDNERMIVPLYSDGFSFSIMAITDNWGESWQFSEPLVGFGNIQPSLAKKKDGTLVAYMRDNGPAPKRLHKSESHDRGMTWSPVRDTKLPNPGSGADVLTLQNGHWLLIYNDSERGRNSLAVSLSEDEGKTWPYKRHVETAPDEENAPSFHYPAMIQARDGSIHATYTSGKWITSTAQDTPRIPSRTIRYAEFDEDWVRAGD